MAQAKLPLVGRKQQIRHQENLRRRQRQRRTEVEVRIRRVAVHPQIPHGRPQGRGNQEEAHHHERVGHVAGAAMPQRQQRHVQGDVTDARIRSEDRDEGTQNGGQHQRLAVQPHGERQQIQQRGVQLERVQEQVAEMVEHLGEEVPEQTDVRLQIVVVETVRNRRCRSLIFTGKLDTYL